MNDLSPEQAVGVRGLEGKETPSVPTIYRHIKDRDEFRPHLRHGNKKYRERSPAKDGRGSIVDQISIDLRPAVVDEMELPPTKDAKELTDTVIAAFEPYKKLLHTVTSDKDLLYHSWERGANENINGLIRQYLPKETSFEELTREQVKWIEWKLNNRPSPLEYISRQIKQIYLTT